MSPSPSPVGSHVPVAGGIHRGLDYAGDIGAEVIQVFVANPRGWATPPGRPADDERLREGSAERGVSVFVHSPYLINLGSPTSATYEHSIASLAHSMVRGGQIGAAGVVVHTGSSVSDRPYADALKQVREALLPMLEQLPDSAPPVLLEPTAGQGRSLCARVEQLAEYFESLEWHPRVGVCLDTCHAFAAGHDLAAPGGMNATLDLLVATVGPGRLKLVHANDSKDPLGSGRDRHERIGTGTIGTAPFAELFAHPALAGVPVVLETPGGKSAYAEDITLLKDLRRS